MKKLLLTTAICAFGTGILRAQTNMDFELWGPTTYGSNDPTGWGTFNLDNFGGPVSTFEETTSPGEGISSVKLVTTTGYAPFFGPGYDTLGGFISLNGDLSGNLIGGIPYTQKPVSMNFLYKSNYVGNDTGVVTVQLQHWDGVQTVVDAQGSINFTSVVSAWTTVNLPINYFTGDTPDTLIILASSSNFVFGGSLPTLPGSELYLDDFVLVLPQPPVVNLGADTTVCGSLLLDAGAGFVIYQWSTGDTTQTTVVSSTDTVSVTVWDSLGFSGSDTIIVTIINTPAVNLGADTSICIGVTLTLDAVNPGSSYLWQDNSTAQTFGATATGTYYVSVSNFCGTSSDTIVVTVNPLPTVNLGADTSICSGDSLVLNAGNPGSAYLWNTGATTQTDTINTTGWYSANVTDINGCSNFDSINVLVITTLVVDLGADITTCDGETAVLDAGVAGADSYMWNTGATTQAITTDTAGTYIVEVNKCGTDTDTVIVIVNPAYSVNASATICSNDSILLGGSYVNTAGTYYDTLTTVNGCDSVIITSLAVTTAPNAGLSDSVEVCNNLLATFNLPTGLGGTPDGGGTWLDDDATGAIIPFTSLIYLNTAGTGTFNFTYVVAGTSPCTNDSATVTVTITPPLTGGSLSACVLEDSLDMFTGLGSYGDSTGTWNDDSATGALTGSIFNPSLVAPGVYNFTYVVAGPSPCDTTATVTVTVVSTPNAGISNPAAVCGDAPLYSLASGLGGTPDTGGSWNDDDGSGAIIFLGNITPFAITPGTYNFTYIVSASGCPDDSATVTLTITKAPNAGTGDTLNVFIGCDTVPVDLSTGLGGTPDGGGTWLDDDATGALTGNVFNKNSVGPGTYNFTYVVAGTGGCANDSATVTVNVSTCTGISEMSPSVLVKIYPNPNNGKFTVEIYDLRFTNYDLTVYDVLGREIFKSYIINRTSYIDLSGHKGVYFLSISNSSGTRTEKLVVY